MIGAGDSTATDRLPFKNAFAPRSLLAALDLDELWIWGGHVAMQQMATVGVSPKRWDRDIGKTDT